MVSDDNVSGTKWPMARLEKVHTVRVQKGVFNSPVQRLHRLELKGGSRCSMVLKGDIPCYMVLHGVS